MSSHHDALLKVTRTPLGVEALSFETDTAGQPVLPVRFLCGSKQNAKKIAGWLNAIEKPGLKLTAQESENNVTLRIGYVLPKEIAPLNETALPNENVPSQLPSTFASETHLVMRKARLAEIGNEIKDDLLAAARRTVSAGNGASL